MMHQLGMDLLAGNQTEEQLRQSSNDCGWPRQPCVPVDVHKLGLGSGSRDYGGGGSCVAMLAWSSGQTWCGDSQLVSRHGPLHAHVPA